MLRPPATRSKDVLVAVEETRWSPASPCPRPRQRLAGALLVGMESRGRGSVVLFAQDPAFRLFWRATTPILLNALLYGPSTGVGGRY